MSSSSYVVAYSCSRSWCPPVSFLCARNAFGKNCVIFITRTALCHLVSEYGLSQLKLPIPVHTPVVITNWILLLQKTITSAFIVSPAAIITLLGRTKFGLTASVISFLVGLISLTLTKDRGLAVIATQAFHGPISNLKPRINNQVEVFGCANKSFLYAEASTWSTPTTTFVFSCANISTAKQPNS